MEYGTVLWSEYWFLLYPPNKAVLWKGIPKMDELETLKNFVCGWFFFFWQAYQHVYSTSKYYVNDAIKEVIQTACVC